MKQRYHVMIQQVITYCADLEIEADSVEHAETIALKLWDRRRIANYLWEETNRTASVVNSHCLQAVRAAR